MDDVESTAVVDVTETAEPTETTVPDTGTPQDDQIEVQEPAEPQEDDISQTKAFSKRLNKAMEAKERELAQTRAEREYLKNQVDAIARARGFESFGELRNADLTERLAKANADGDRAAARAIMKEIADLDPEKEQLRQNLRTVEEARAAEWLDEQVRAIAKIDPYIKSFDDIQKLDTFSDIDRLARAGVSLVDAYKAANFERLQKKRSEIVQKQTAINANSKKHLPNTKTGAAPSDVVVPDAVYRVYKTSGLTDAQIKAHYAQYLKDNE